MTMVAADSRIASCSTLSDVPAPTSGKGGFSQRATTAAAKKKSKVLPSRTLRLHSLRSGPLRVSDFSADSLDMFTPLCAHNDSGKSTIIHAQFVYNCDRATLIRRDSSPEAALAAGALLNAIPPHAEYDIN